MPYNLKSRRLLITAGSRGLGAEIVRKFAGEGCNIAINYHENTAAAEALKEEVVGKYGIEVVLLKGDAGIMADCEGLVKDTVDAFGGIDIIIGNAGWTRFSPFEDLHGMSEEEWDKCWAVNVKGQMALVRAAMPHFNQNPEGGVFIMTSSVAGVKPSGSSLPYSVTKAAGLQLMKGLASSQGKNVRINAVLPGLLLTEWGKKFSPERIKFMEEKAVLKKTADLEDTADAYIMLAKNTSITGMKIQIDGGLFVDTP